MASSELVLCSLKVVGGDVLERGAQLEARRRGKGFSVWVWNGAEFAGGLEIAATSQPYDARALAQIMFDKDVAVRLFRGQRLWLRVSVTGERGLKAYLLRLAFACGWHDCRRLMDLPEATFDTLDKLAGDEFADGDLLVGETGGPALFSGIVADAKYLELELDAPALLRRYGLTADTASLRTLGAALGRESEQREDEYSAPVDPFADRIEWMVGVLDISLRPYRVGFPPAGASHKIWSLRNYLTRYVRLHARLPTGSVTIPERVDPSLGGHEAFEVDCDALADEAARICTPLGVPATYRLPRRKRVAYFQKEIKAIAKAFGQGAFVTPHGLEPSDREFWMRSFLENFVVYYERLPHGTMRADQSRVPFVLYYQDLGDVDFDQLRKAAEVVADTADDIDHIRLAP